MAFESAVAIVEIFSKKISSRSEADYTLILREILFIVAYHIIICYILYITKFVIKL